MGIMKPMASGFRGTLLHHSALSWSLGQRLVLSVIVANCFMEKALQQAHAAGRASLHLSVLEEATQ